MNPFLIVLVSKLKLGNGTKLICTQSKTFEAKRFKICYVLVSLLTAVIGWTVGLGCSLFRVLLFWKVSGTH